jgi:hypothetical protein
MPLQDPEGHVSFYGVEVKRESEKALLVRLLVPIRKGSTTKIVREVWISKKLIHEDSEVYKAGTSGRLVVPLFLAERERLPT